MGKHKGQADGTGWDSLTPAEKAAEFDKSHDNPARYAHENFVPQEHPEVYGDGSKHAEYRAENERDNRRGK